MKTVYYVQSALYFILAAVFLWGAFQAEFFVRPWVALVSAALWTISGVFTFKTARLQ